jgi:hypothetical protein
MEQTSMVLSWQVSRWRQVRVGAWSWMLHAEPQFGQGRDVSDP